MIKKFLILFFLGVLGNIKFYFLSPYFDMNMELSNNSCLGCLYHGINWLYTYCETIYAYEFRTWYNWYANSLYDDSFDYFFNLYWFFNLSLSSFQLYWGAILDKYVYLSLFKLPFSSDWFRFIFSLKESSIVLVYHPELIFFNENIITNNFFNYLGNISFSLYEQVESEIFFSPVMLFPQLLLIFFFAIIFISFYFVYFTSANKEENIIDTDYLVASSTVEAEKEITSFDDTILALVVLFYIFGWYFFIHCWSMLSMMPELIFVFFLFPGLYYIIIGIPTFLIYDFGAFFLAYLRGVGPSSILIFELMYDYIAVIIFYTRILVQGVRLVLMTFTYASMHDLIIFLLFSYKIFFGFEAFWEELNSLSITLSATSYFYIFSLMGTFVYWIYELLHTLFVVTAQFVAFFAIVFWLFLFLYTFFVLEKQENYFTDKRNEKSKKLNYLHLLKN